MYFIQNAVYAMYCTFDTLIIDYVKYHKKSIIFRSKCALKCQTKTHSILKCMSALQCLTSDYKLCAPLQFSSIARSTTNIRPAGHALIASLRIWFSFTLEVPNCLSLFVFHLNL